MVKYEIGQQVLITDNVMEHKLRIGSIATIIDEHEGFPDVYLLRGEAENDSEIIQLLSASNFVPVTKP